MIDFVELGMEKFGVCRFLEARHFVISFHEFLIIACLSVITLLLFLCGLLFWQSDEPADGLLLFL